MKISVGSDERNTVTDAVVDELKRRELAEIEADHLPEP
jgi:hypothetical protein